MLNIDSIIKFIRNTRGHRLDWPKRVNCFLDRLEEIKLGFPGLGNNHFSLVPYSEIIQGDFFIVYECIEDMSRMSDNAPLLLKYLGQDLALIEGIGCGLDSKRDPNRILFRWRDQIKMPNLSADFPVLRVNVRPTLNGGPAYYYFYRAYRDNRY